MNGVLAALVLCALGLARADGRQAVHELASPDPERARAAAAELRALGPEVLEWLWEGFSEAPSPERRARARWLVEAALPGALAPASAALADPDPEVRRLVARYLGRVDVPPEERERRLAALAEAAEVEAVAVVRDELAQALVAVGGEPAARSMARLLTRWPSPDLALLAARLAGLPGARTLVLELVPAAFSAPPVGAPLPDDVLAALLPAYGQALADAGRGGETARERAPLLLGLRHPSPRVRRAASVAIDDMVTRLRLLDRTRRADRLLAAVAAEGPEPREALHRRALHALQEGLDPDLARQAAAELERLAQSGLRRSDRRWRFRAAYLEGAAEVAAGRPAAARAPLERAAGVLEGLLGERADLAADGGREDQHQLLLERAMLEVMRAVRLVAEGRGAADLELLGRLREAHELQLRAQLLAAEADLVEVNFLDVLLETGTSPYRLVFARKPHAAWPVDRCLDAQAKLGRALATIAPLELPGFEPVPEVLEGRGDPLVDPVRFRLLTELLAARARAAERQYMEERTRLWEKLRRGEVIGPGEEEQLARLEQLSRRRGLQRSEGPAENYHELRTVSWAALRLGRDLREEGRTRECREVCGRMLADIEGRALEQRYTWALDLAAEVQIAIGASWTADDEGVKAEDELQRAVERLEALEGLLLERGALDMAADVRTSRASALVSLAVNANVKLTDARKATEYFERAYELRQDDFMRVLLACYRARSGREAEARELVAGVPPAPPYYYNLACTYALLGEVELALEFLERELVENHPSEGSLKQQKDWARRDPDLAPLWTDPRFLHLVGRTEGEDE